MIKLLPFFMLIFLSGCFEYSLSDKKEIIDQRFEGEWTLLDENKKPSSTIRISSVDKYNYKITTKEKNQEVEYVFYVINYEGSNIMQIHLPDNSWLYAEYSISNKNIRIKLADWGLFYDDRGEKNRAF